MGYVPLFDNLTTGTLHGRWPDIGLWPVVLSLANRFGEIDVTPQFIASATGLPVEEVVACMRRFCEPDPNSRTSTHEGRRLELIDPQRQWGWHVINHSAYREKARLLARDSARTASGADAERKRRERAAVPAGPPPSPEIPPSDSDSNSEKNTTAPAAPDWFLDFKLAYPIRAGDQGWRKAQKAANARIREGHTPAQFLDGARRYAAFIAATDKTGTEYVKQAATFLGPDKPFLETWEQPTKVNGIDVAAEEAWVDLLTSQGAKRDARVQQAIEAVGGWLRIQLRTAFDSPIIKRDFCAAWAAAGVGSRANGGT